MEEEEVTLNVFNAIKHPHENDSCFSIDVVEAIVSNQVSHTDLLETSLLHVNLGDLEDEEVNEYLLWMDSFRLNRMKFFEALGASPSRPIPFVEKPHVIHRYLYHMIITHHSILDPILPSLFSLRSNDKIM